MTQEGTIEAFGFVHVADKAGAIVRKGSIAWEKEVSILIEVLLNIDWNAHPGIALTQPSSIL